MAASLEQVKQYTDNPRVAVIHFGRASNVYMVVGKGGGGDGGGASKMIEWAGGEMAVDTEGMQRMASPEIIAQANPDIILVTDYGYDRLGGSIDQIKASARRRHVERREERPHLPHRGKPAEVFRPATGENIEKVAAIIHQK